MTIEEAKEFLKRNWEDGCKCPACGQHVQLYDYKFYATSAYALILLYRLGEGFHHVREFAEASEERARAPHFAELRFWGLVQKADNDNPAKKSSGYWKITDLGKQFVRGEITVYSRILVYNNKFQGFSEKSVPITIQEALTNKFDYSELMSIKQEALL